jgi:hypothetical protein
VRIVVSGGAMIVQGAMFGPRGRRLLPFATGFLPAVSGPGPGLRRRAEDLQRWLPGSEDG